MSTIVRLDDTRLLQLIRNTKLWPSFPIFKNLALKAQAADGKISSSRTGCAPCAARKRQQGRSKLAEVVKGAKEAIIRMPQEKREQLKKALAADYIKLVTLDAGGRPKELMY